MNKETLKQKLERILANWDKLSIWVYSESGKKAVMLNKATEERQALAILGWISSYNPVIQRIYELLHFMWDWYGRKERVEINDKNDPN